jgi:hypothetical protein
MTNGLLQDSRSRPHSSTAPRKTSHRSAVRSRAAPTAPSTWRSSRRAATAADRLPPLEATAVQQPAVCGQPRRLESPEFEHGDWYRRHLRSQLAAADADPEGAVGEDRRAGGFLDPRPLVRPRLSRASTQRGCRAWGPRGDPGCTAQLPGRSHSGRASAASGSIRVARCAGTQHAKTMTALMMAATLA